LFSSRFTRAARQVTFCWFGSNRPPRFPDRRKGIPTPPPFALPGKRSAPQKTTQRRESSTIDASKQNKRPHATIGSIWERIRSISQIGTRLFSDIKRRDIII